jgi:hypothetical protein
MVNSKDATPSKTVVNLLTKGKGDATAYCLTPSTHPKRRIHLEEKESSHGWSDDN